MLKVAHIVRRFTFDEWGGTETVVWNTVTRQRQRGIQADILATAALSQPGDDEREGVPIHRFPYVYPYWPMTASTRLALDKKGGSPLCPKMFRAIRNGGYDLLHIHAAGRLAQRAVATAHSIGIPCIMSIHGGSEDVPPEELRRMMEPVKGKFNYGGILDRLCGMRFDPLARVNAVICIGRVEEARLHNKYPKQRIIYMPNGIDCARYQRPVQTHPREEWGIPSDRKLLVCISRIDYQKNQKALVPLLAAHEDTHLLLIGPATAEWYRDELLAEVQKRGLQERFTYIPGLSPDDPRLVDILHEAYCFILPSVHEPFGIVALEAWAAGLPVIASNAGGLKDFIKDGVNGLMFPSGDDDALEEAFKRMDGNDSLRNRLTEQALQDVQKFSWDSLADELIAIYHSFL
ncbi:MAG: glycosyltransferase family 4 protein [Victivallales bacterium]|nr:glycosyltransferase family 4 protein [Victivallales bacterium]